MPELDPNAGSLAAAVAALPVASAVLRIFGYSRAFGGVAAFGGGRGGRRSNRGST